MNIVILAAGKGTRMYSSLPKVMQPLGGKPMLGWVIDTVKSFEGNNDVFVIVGHGKEIVKQAFSESQVSFVEQLEQKGTGHALMQVLPFLNNSESTLVLFGDCPLIRKETLESLIDVTADGFGILTIDLENPTGYGRMIRREGKVVAIVEQKDLTEEQKAIHEINTGIMVLPTARLGEWLPKIGNNNKQGEYYLTDLVALAVQDGVDIQTLKAKERSEVEGANNMVQLAYLERSLQRWLARKLNEQGVRMADPERIDIRGNLTCGKDVFIDVGCVFEGEVVLGNGVSVGPYCHIRDARISDGTQLDSFCHINGAQIGADAKIGPLARLRPGTVLSDEVHVGDFVEIKKSTVGKGSKINHLSYIGDCEMGSGVNIGAGTITCNYDGVNKFKTIIEDNCFIGSDTQLVAPVAVRKDATVGAGSTITKEVPENTLAISRARQVVITGWKRPVKKESN